MFANYQSLQGPVVAAGSASVVAPENSEWWSYRSGGLKRAVLFIAGANECNR